jgi:integrase/recombinase XerD
MTWKHPEIVMYRVRYKVGTTARFALELMLNIAGRRQDAHALGRQHVTEEGKLSWRPQKTMRSSGKLLTIRIMPQLREAIDAMPPSGELRFLLNDYGKPFASAAAFGNKFADWCKAAGLQPVLCADGRVRSFRAHGLRKAAAVAMAHAGCTEQEMMSVGG